MSQPTNPEPTPQGQGKGEAPKAKEVRGRRLTAAFVAVAIGAALLSALVSSLLINIYERKQEAKFTILKMVEVDDNTTDPVPWGMNWPREYDQYLRTSDVSGTRFGGSETLPKEKAQREPWLTRIFAGYAFSLDYRDRRGHQYMLNDQEMTRRVNETSQTGSCLNCHASIIPTFRRLGAEALGQQPADAFDFDWPAVMKGFELVSHMKYTEGHAALLATADGHLPEEQEAQIPHVPPLNPPATLSTTGSTTRQALAGQKGRAHPVSCVDCHDPKVMELRVTRPGFVRGIQELAASDVPTPQIPSIERWRKGSREKPYDPNTEATRQEMRSFVCGQCHVTYYCGPKATLFFPWGKGLNADQIGSYFDDYKFSDGHRFYDWKHGETGAELIKAKHPEFETWSQGLHARSGVACADCHMPYMRQGAVKISDHWVRSPLLNVARSCQPCHQYPEEELLERAETIQDRHHQSLERAGTAVVAMIDAINQARKSGASDDQLKKALEFHRQAQWRLDFVAAENSMGFHAPQELSRVLGEAIDLARQGQIEAIAVTNKGGK